MPEFFSKWHEIKGQKYIHKKKNFKRDWEVKTKSLMHN